MSDIGGGGMSHNRPKTDIPARERVARPTRDQIAEVLRAIPPKHGGYMTTEVTPKAADRMADAVLALMDGLPRAEDVWRDGYFLGDEWGLVPDGEGWNVPYLDNPYKTEEDRHVDQ